jgi:hypothetical protein
MQEYKITEDEMNNIVNMLFYDWEITGVEACQGYMRIYFQKGDEGYHHIDLDAI